MALGEDSPASERSGWKFSRKEIHKRVGPSNPLYHIYLDNAIQDMHTFKDDFDILTGTNIWTFEDSSAATVISLNTDAVSGQVSGATSGTNNGWIRMRTAQEIWNVDHRCVAMWCFNSSAFDSDDDLLKIEAGFHTGVSDADNAGEDDSDNAGQVKIKATPTDAVNDFAVVCLDTDDNVYWDVIADDGGTTATSNVSSSLHWASSSSTTAVTDQTTIAFISAGGGADTITDSNNGFAVFASGDVITVTGSARNNGTYTIITGGVAGTITLGSGILTTEAAGESVTVTTPDLTNGDSEWQTTMVACNEQQEVRGWINGAYIGRVAGPDGDIALGLWFFAQTREAETRTIGVDYCKAWQERRAIS